MKKLAVAATALALFATTLTAAPATAAGVPSHQAKYGAACATLKQVAPRKGADGSNLVCEVETAGTYAGKRIWAYAQFPTIKEMDLYMAGGAGGGDDLFGRELMRSMRAEGTLLADATFRNISGAAGTTGLAQSRPAHRWRRRPRNGRSSGAGGRVAPTYRRVAR